MIPRYLLKNLQPRKRYSRRKFRWRPLNLNHWKKLIKMLILARVAPTAHCQV